MRTIDRRGFLASLSGMAVGGALGGWSGALSAAPLDKVRQTGALRVAVYKDTEPPRDCRRPVGLNYAATGTLSSMA